MVLKEVKWGGGYTIQIMESHGGGLYNMGNGLERTNGAYAMWVMVLKETNCGCFLFFSSRATSAFSRDYFVIGIHEHKTGDSQVAIITVDKHMMDCMNKYNEIVADLRKGFSHREVHFENQSVNAAQNPAFD